MGTIHHGTRVEPNGRYDRFLTFLRGRGTFGATTRELIDATGFCAVNSIVSELRAMGYSIPKPLDEGLNENGSRVFRYQLTGEPKRFTPIAKPYPKCES
jgi:hypothetical protein